MSAEYDTAGDAGLTLIELIVYMLLAGVIVLATAMILVNSWNTQKDVTSVSEATVRGQSLGSTIERAMRNGLAFDVSSDGTELRVRTSLGGNLQCQGFVLMDGYSRVNQSAGTLPSPTSSWTVWKQGISKDGMTPYFATSGQVVTYTFRISTDAAPVRITGEASTRSTPTGVSSPCW